MVTLDRVQRGAARYIDAEFTAKLTGWQKWAVGAGAAMALQNLSVSVNRWKDNEAVKMLGVFGDNNAVDVDKLYRYFRAEAEKGPVTVTVPAIGPVTLNVSDVEKLYNCIMQS